MDKIKKVLSNRWGAYSIAAIAGVVAYLILSHLPEVTEWLSGAVNVLSPIIIGLIVAYLIDLLVVFFETKVFKKMSRPRLRYVLSVVISILLVILSVAFFFWLVLPEMIRSITHFFSGTKNYISQVEDKLEALDDFAKEYNFDIGAKNWTNNVFAYLNNKFSNFSQNLQYARDTVVSIWNIALNTFIGVIIAVYFLFGKKRLFAGIDNLRRAMLTEDQYKRHTSFLRRSNAIFSKYISFTILEAIAVGLANAAFMLIAGMPNVVLISVVVGVTNILPTFGPIAGCVIGAFILVLDDPMYALIFIIFTCILQTIDGYVVKPHLFGDSLGIPAVISLISIVIGGKLFGPLGILISIPFTAVMAILYHERLIPWLEEKKHEREEAPKKPRRSKKAAAAAEEPKKEA